ncbi:CDC36 [Sanghuangporus sanghuang]
MPVPLRQTLNPDNASDASISFYYLTPSSPHHPLHLVFISCGKLVIGQPPQRPPNLGPTQGLGGPFRAPFPPASAFGLPSRNPLQTQGFPGMPNAHRTGAGAAGQSMVLPSPSFLQQRGQAGFPFGNALGQPQQNQQQSQHQHPASQVTSLLGQQLQQQQQQQSQQNASSVIGSASHLPNPSLTTTTGQVNQSSPNEGAGLDPNDFPALGSGTGTTMNASTNSPATTLASSYASQAGTGLTPGTGANGQGAASGSAQTREFTPDDFPALGGQPTSTTQSSQNQPSSQDTSHPPGLNGFETRQTMPPGLLNLSAAQRGLAAAPDADKRAANAKVNNTWNGTNASTSAQQNGSLQPSAPQQLNAPPGVPLPFQQQQTQQPSYGAVADGVLGTSAPGNAGTTSSAAPQTPAQQILMSAADRWGLLGLLNAIKNADADQNLLSIGTDLGTMGLDMQHQGSLFSTFITPWSDSSAAHTVEPDFHLPPCYNVNAPPPGPAKAQAFSEETLFYMFYAHPRDALQEVAAQELFQRNWRFNKELRLWLTKETGRPRNSKTIDNGAGEQGMFTYWDPDMWEKSAKEFTVMYADLENKETPAFAGPTLQPTAQGQQLQAGAVPPSVNSVVQLAQRSQVFYFARAARMPFGQPSPAHSLQLAMNGPMLYAPQMHGSSVIQQPFLDHSITSDAPSFSTDISESSAQKIAMLQAKLDKKLGPEYISQRPGPGGNMKLTYAEGWKIINLANEVFGFNGWSSSIVNLNTDFIDYNEETKKFNVGVSAVIKVTLRDGVYHEDVGYGMLEGSRSKGAALDKCKKEAVTDGIKRALRNFGNLLGNCLYDKQYTQEIVKIKVPPAKFDKNALHRRPEFQEGNSTGTTAPNAAGPSTTTALSAQNAPAKPIVLPKAIGMNSFSATPHKSSNPPNVSATSVPAQVRRPTTSTPLRSVTPQAIPGASGVNRNGSTSLPPKPQPPLNVTDSQPSSVKIVNYPSNIYTSKQAGKTFAASTELKTAFKPLQDLGRADTYSFDSDEDEDFLAALEKAEGDAIYNDRAADLGRPIDEDEGIGGAIELEEEAIYISSSDEKTLVEEKSRQAQALKSKNTNVPSTIVKPDNSNPIPAVSRGIMQPRNFMGARAVASPKPTTESEDEIARQIIAMRQKRRSAAAPTSSATPTINENVLPKTSVQNVPAQTPSSSKPQTLSMGGFNFLPGMSAPLSSGMRQGQVANVQAGLKRTVDSTTEVSSGISYANAQEAAQARSGVREPFTRLDDRSTADGSDAKRVRIG